MLNDESPDQRLVGIQPPSAPAPIEAYMPQDTEVPDLHELVVDSPPTSHVQEALPLILAAEETGDHNAGHGQRAEPTPNDRERRLAAERDLMSYESPGGQRYFHPDQRDGPLAHESAAKPRQVSS